MLIRVRVTTGARKEEVIDGDPVIVKVNERPERGKANKRVIELISEHFGKKAVLVSGATNKNKVISLI